MASADDVQLPDLQVIQRYSLAVRAASAPRADVVAALQADLAWLSGGARPRSAGPAAAPAQKPAAKKAPDQKAPVKPAPVARKSPAKKAARRA